MPDKTNISISNTLSRLLILTVITVSFVTAGIIYAVVSQREHAQLEDKADKFITSIDDVLEIPLWNLDYQTIRKIAKAYANDELFEQLRIEDSLGVVCFDFSQKRDAPVIRKSTDIFHEGRLVGHVSMAYTTKNLSHNNYNLLIFGLGILAMVIFTLAFVTGIFFKRLLKNLFDRLNAISDAYALGKEDGVIEKVPYMEFKPLINILKKMRDKLNLQFQDIQLAEKKYRSIFENAVEGIYQSTPEGRMMDVNPAMANMLGYDSSQHLQQSVSDIGKQLYIDPELREKYIELNRKKGIVSNFEAEFRKLDGGTAWLVLNSRPIFDSDGNLVLIEGMAKDITHQKAEEEKRKQLEAQLQHSQKLESVGRLAGGVAHDFNNMLSIILGYSDILLETLPQDSLEHENILEIKSAAERSADLTGQLLAFARKQTASPKSMDLNKTIPDMLKMLQRLLGEDIKLTFLPGKDLEMVFIDPTQIDQVLANLCINARDAITGTGEISIKTETVFLDEDACRQNPDAAPGPYVMLSVCDDGFGMDKSTLKQIFEPFFTTKGTKKGTGLGLSTVYGIVRQNMGHISVESEPGQGTTFKVYLPVCHGHAEAESELSETDAHQTGSETILLVEDEESLLVLTRRILEHLGYKVLPAGSPLEALQISKEYQGNIHLMMTDVIMPGMTGRELSVRLSEERPEMICIYISGYTSDILAPKGVLDKDLHFIQKPFTKKILAARLREILSSAGSRPKLSQNN